MCIIISVKIYQEAKKYAKPFGMRVVCAYGGGNMYEQQCACEAGAEIVVCTPVQLLTWTTPADIHYRTLLRSLYGKYFA